MISTAPVMTDAGVSLQIRAMMGTTINFTRFAIGNGRILSESEIGGLTDLVNPLVTFGITEIEKEGNHVILTGTFSSTDIEEDFVWREMGVYCQPEDGEEVLYAYANDGDSAGTLTKLGSAVSSEQTVEMVIICSNSENVTATIADSAVYATKEEVKEHIENGNNPHGITAEQIGLGNVPNVTTNNQTPTYLEAGELKTLESGEILSIAFGKLKKAVSSMIDHLKNGVIHITAEERTSWNGKAAGNHDHSAASITSGTLGIPRGGTGANTAKGARSSLSVALAPATMSYTGQGRTGSGSKNSLTFSSGIPEVVLIFQNGYGRLGILYPKASRGLSFVDGVISTLIVSASGNVLYWYYNSTESHPANQLDHSGQTYYVTGIYGGGY